MGNYILKDGRRNNLKKLIKMFIISVRTDGRVIIITIQQKIDIACSIAGVTQAELAKRLGTSAPAWNKRLKTGKFSDEDFKNIAQALGCTYKSGFYFPDGNKVD